VSGYIYSVKFVFHASSNKYQISCRYCRSGGKYHLLFLTFLLAMICTIIALFLPETINDPLPETINDIRFNTGKNDLGDCCSCISYAEEGLEYCTHCFLFNIWGNL
jgi:hypothetical protein